MTRTKILLLSAACALTVAFGSPAFALNPQPLPPGIMAHINIHTNVPTINQACVTGQHIGRQSNR
jgi:hypothetical protein